MLRRQKHVLSQSTTPFACTLDGGVFFSVLSLAVFVVNAGRNSWDSEARGCSTRCLGASSNQDLGHRVLSGHFSIQKGEICSVPQTNQRKTKGQQLKGKIVQNFHVFFFHKFSHFFIVFHQDFPLQNKGFYLAQGERKRRKDNKKNRTNRCCTLVVARLSSS